MFLDLNQLTLCLCYVYSSLCYEYYAYFILSKIGFHDWNHFIVGNILSSFYIISSILAKLFDCLVSHYSFNEFSKAFFTTHIIFLWNISLLRYLNTFTSHCMFIKHAKFKQGEEKRKDIKIEKSKQKLNLSEFPVPRNFRGKKRGQRNRVCWEQRSWDSDSGKETDLRVSSIAASRDELFSWRRASSVYQRGSSVTDRSARHSSR